MSSPLPCSDPFRSTGLLPVALLGAFVLGAAAAELARAARRALAVRWRAASLGLSDELERICDAASRAQAVDSGGALLPSLGGRPIVVDIAKTPDGEARALVQCSTLSLVALLTNGFARRRRQTFLLALRDGTWRPIATGALLVPS